MSLDDHEHEKDTEETKNKILSAAFVNDSSIKVLFEHKLDTDRLPQLEISADKKEWRRCKINLDGFINNVKSDDKYIRAEHGENIIEIESAMNNNQFDGNSCVYKGINRKLNEEFNDGCSSFCVCKNTGVKCLPFECPTYFGVDVLDPGCINWETSPANFTAIPPNCCPEKLVCKSNGSCELEGNVYQNWQQIPENITGCEKRCFCEMGHIECQNVCPPVTALPPANLACPTHLATLERLNEDDCCLYWMCKEDQMYTGNFLNYIKVVLCSGINDFWDLIPD